MTDQLHPLKTNVQAAEAVDRQPSVFLRMFSRRWILATLLVIVGMGVMIRLGKWQLDRLAARRAFNAQVLSQINQPELDLNASLPDNLDKMEYRHVVVVGEYDPAQEVALRNQAYNYQYGAKLLTPLHIAGSDQSILVDRGWVPDPDFKYTGFEQYTEPGRVEVHGIIRASQDRPDYGWRSDPTPMPGERLTAWYFANVKAISQQVPYSLLPVYIQQAPDPSWTGLPERTQPELDLSEGPHQGYAIQWFSFAALLGIGYPFFIRKQERSDTEKKIASASESE